MTHRNTTPGNGRRTAAVPDLNRRHTVKHGTRRGAVLTALLLGTILVLPTALHAIRIAAWP